MLDNTHYQAGIVQNNSEIAISVSAASRFVASMMMSFLTLSICVGPSAPHAEQTR